ncbi:serine/threonine-protein phosphatase [Actinospica durhamensis]|uniref:Serine/threonine-protein phosphatase n=1 Tax=Actinospica durhamensis TaxID=1508375 RepID=A0A941F053_9ACTN|nr:PP2C family protein-serine/threonine phosphatase [Actinospica durhamensis]MBR7837724.1 serine/threonine-protein phosphatase [Actinospica durhamensis]
MSSQFSADSARSAHSGPVMRVLPYALIVVIIAADLASPRSVGFSPTLSVPPALAALIAPPRQIRPLLVGGICVVTATLLGLLAENVIAVELAAELLATAMVTLVSWVAVRSAQLQQRTLTTVRTVAEAAQQVLLRALPSDLVSVRSAVRYVAAAAEARIGGDLYEVMTTKFGDRLIIGDVRGKGLPAVEAAADVLGVFREAAHQEGDLSAIALRMHASLGRRTAADAEEFVTAVLVSVPPGSAQAEIVNCGHPAPLLLHHGVVTPLDPPEPSPPLGLLNLSADSVPVYKVDFEPGDHILLYTDGITEARDEEGAFYRLEQDKGWTVYQNPDPMLDHVLRAVRAHAGPRLSDDIALLAVKRLPDPEL